MTRTVKVPEQFTPIFEAAERVVAEHFATKREDPERGVIEIGGERYVLMRAPALSVEFHDLIEGLTPDGRGATQTASDLLFQLAASIGQSDAAALHREMGLVDPIARLSAGPVHFAHAGWASVTLLEGTHPSVDEDCVIYYEHPYSFESDSWKAVGRTSSRPVCSMNAGYSSGWCSASFGLDLVAVELLCTARGDECCRFIMAPRHRLAQRYAEYLAANPAIAARAAALVPPRHLDAVGLAQRLELSEARYQKLFEASLDAVFLLRDERIVSVNRAGQRLLGRSLAELSGTRVATHSPTLQPTGARSEAALSAYSAASSGGVPTTFHWRFSRPDGSAVETEVTLGRIEGTDEFELIARDRTNQIAAEAQRRRLEQEMRQLQKMEALGTLAGGVAHDFNNLLATISINLELLDTVTTDASGREWLAGAQKGLERSAGIVRQLLTFARSSQDAEDPIDLAALTEDNVSMIRDTIDRRIRVVLDLATSDSVVRGNPNYLSQVVVNLLLNSRDALTPRLASRRGARIDVSVTADTRDGPSGEPVEVVGLIVRDNGHGMSSEVTARAFEPFFTTKGAGSGLGLSTVYGIVNQHGGWIEVESEPDVGTEVSVWLPALDAVVVSKPAPAALAAPPRPLTVLVVEDEPDLLRMASRVLQTRGHTVLAAADGLAGQELWDTEHHRIDAVLLDLTMPRMSGRALLARIRETKSSCHIVVTSGYSGDGQATEVLALGAAGFLPKPYRLASLLNAIEQA